MSTIQNEPIALYFHFNKIIEKPETSFQPSALSQKLVTNVCRTTHQHFTKSHFDCSEDSKEISVSVTTIM